MHLYLIINAKSELKFLNEDISLETFNKTFDQIASAMANRSNLFEDNEKFETNFIFEHDEIEDIEELNNNNLEIIDYIDLLVSILNADNINFNKQEEKIRINHEDLDFDVDKMVKNLKS
ncbi:6555_t:CDS:1 [Funneliformis mosseae]|uniref:6555_t:CDS:1 n=1 Tax=Funneliformis mosseae TaxID=27381 RepID=A0A9N9E282_FUNMO|nr:6555_t:CDS:1 [Funneliformis mosseae]